MNMLDYLKVVDQNSLMYWFLVAVLFDLLTGIGKAIVCKQLNSTIGREGLVRHLTIVIICSVVYMGLNVMEQKLIANALIGFYIAVYAISVIENLDELGVPIPNSARDFFAKLKDSKSNGGKKI